MLIQLMVQQGGAKQRYAKCTIITVFQLKNKNIMCSNVLISSSLFVF